MTSSYCGTAALVVAFSAQLVMLGRCRRSSRIFRVMVHGQRRFVNATGRAAAVVAAINRTLNAVFQDAEYKKQMTELGVNLVGGVPKDLTAFIAAERKKWLPLIQRQGIKAY